jgi:hypothetical protein
MSSLLFGCDVSGWQPSTLVPWSDTRINFGLVKFSEGDGQASSAAGHVAHIRACEKPLGAYHFFHPECDARSQFEAFDGVSSRVGYGKPGDIVPAIDVEYFKGHGVTKYWTPLLDAFAALLEEGYHCKPMLYINAATWQLLGSPAWVLEHPLWVPFFSLEKHPAPASLPLSVVPGKLENWAIWQRLGGKLFGNVQEQAAYGAVDQNLAQRLPLIGET